MKNSGSEFGINPYGANVSTRFHTFTCLQTTTVTPERFSTEGDSNAIMLMLNR